MSDKEPITEPSMNERIIYEVIVVGLGPAGIAAFSKLAENNLKVLGLEASNRTGGRICSIKFGDAKIDMGAEWCHGENDNVIYEMIKDLNVVESSGSYDVLQTTYCDSKGEQLPNDLALLIAQLCTETMDSAKAIIKEEQSLGEILIQVFGDLLKKPQYENIPKDRASQALEWLHKYENSIDCSESWFETSKTTLEEYWHCEGDPLLHWKGNGFSTILDVMMKTYPNPHNPEDFEILINKEVINILYENEDMKDIVKVLCTDGTIYYGKHLIITVSLGVLKDRHNALFNPPLPEDKVNCIDNIMFGTVDKVYLQFESRWWTTEYSWVGFFWNEEDFKDIPQEDQWLINVFGFHSNLTQPNLMCLWVTGSNAIYMEKLSNDIVKEKLLALLGRFFGKNCNIPPVLDIARSQWYSDPFFRGSYSCRSVDSDKANVSSEKLGEPILGVNQKPFLCFAGEATSPHYYSTVHGAVMSGHREAQRIIDYVSLKKSDIIPNFTTREFYDVVIVGAGVAGIGAAQTLISNGVFNIKVLEASSRVGGRIDTFHMNNGDLLEYGAQWIHGKNNKLAKYAQANGLVSDALSYEGEGKFFNEHGMEYSTKDIERVGNLVSTILKQCESFAVDDCSECDFSVGHYLRNEFELYIGKNVDVSEHKKWRDILQWNMCFYLIDNACDSLDDLSAKYWGFYDFDGEDYQIRVNLRNGFSSVINSLHDDLPKDIFKMSTAVEKILWNKSGGIEIRCQGETVIETKHVIVTVSLGVLKSCHRDMFEPILPLKHGNVVDNMGFGMVGKIFLQFNESWWGDNKGFQFIWTQDITENKTFTKEEHWLKYISGFDVLTVGAANYLLGWVASDGERNLQNVSEVTVKNHCHKLLEVFTGDSVPMPMNAYWSTWSGNPYQLGGYSHITTSCDKSKIDPSILTEPIVNIDGKIEILFAGEACHQKFFSTAHGAYESGIEQAEKVCKLFNKKSKLKADYSPG